MSAQFKSVQRYLLILLAASPLVAISAEERIQKPTFGEQMSVIVEAHERGEITYQEMMELRRELSGQFGREYQTPQLPNCEGARRFLPKCMHRISTQNSRKSTAPTTDPDSIDCGGLRKFTPRCLSRPNPFEIPSDEPVDAPLEQIELITEIEELEPTGTMAEEEKELRPQPATIEPKESEVEISVDEPELNCEGLRKFTLRCLRRPDPFEEAKKEATHLEVEIAPEKPAAPEEPKEESAQLEVEIAPEKPEAKPPLEIKIQKPAVTTQPQEPEPVSVVVEKVIIEEKVEEAEEVPQQVNCTGLRRFTSKCKRKQDAPQEPKKEAAHLKVDIAPEKPEAMPPLEIKIQESKPEPVSITVDQVEKEQPEVLNCTGMRKFSLKCLRRPNPFEDPPD